MDMTAKNLGFEGGTIPTERAGLQSNRAGTNNIEGVNSMKNKVIKKLVTGITCSCIAFSLVACGSSESSDNNQEGAVAGASREAKEDTPADGKISFSIAIMNGPKVEDTWIEHQIEEKFNCDVELVFLPGWEDLTTKVNLLMSDDSQRPDVIWWSGLEDEYKEWVEEGLLVDLVPLLQNIDNSNILSYYDEWAMFPNYTNGSIYSIPGDIAEVSCMGTFVRKDWLEKLNMQEPTTMDEYVEYLLACVNNDPDGNGEKDTYGFGGDSGDWKYLAPFLYSYKADVNHFVKNDEGKIVHGSTQPQVKEALALMADLYQKGVFEPSIFSASEGETLFAEGKVGSFYRYLVSLNPSQQYLQNFYQNNPDGKYEVIEPIKGPDGYSTDESENGHGWCSYAITKNCKNPQRVMEIMDGIASGEIFILDKWGVEGETYELTEDGAVNFIVDETKRNEMGLSTFTGFVNRKDSYNIQNSKEVNDLFERAANTSLPLKDYRVDLGQNGEVWKEYSPELLKLRDEYFYGIIMGERDIDDFDEYVELFYSHGGTEAEEEANRLYKDMDSSFDEFTIKYKEWFN